MNKLQLHFQATHITRVSQPVVALPDRRYRLLVTLIRADRPRYWNFLCFNCGAKVVELLNYEVVTVDDFYDPQNINNAGVGRHCKGQTQEGTDCPYTYFFKLQ